MHYQVFVGLFDRPFCYCRSECVKVLSRVGVCQSKSLPRLMLKSFAKNTMGAFRLILFRGEIDYLKSGYTNQF